MDKDVAEQLTPADFLYKELSEAFRGMEGTSKNCWDWQFASAQKRRLLHITSHPREHCSSYSCKILCKEIKHFNPQCI